MPRPTRPAPARPAAPRTVSPAYAALEDAVVAARDAARFDFETHADGVALARPVIEAFAAFRGPLRDFEPAAAVEPAESFEAIAARITAGRYFDRQDVYDLTTDASHYCRAILAAGLLSA